MPSTTNGVAMPSQKPLIPRCSFAQSARKGGCQAHKVRHACGSSCSHVDHVRAHANDRTLAKRSTTAKESIPNQCCACARSFSARCKPLSDFLAHVSILATVQTCIHTWPDSVGRAWHHAQQGVAPI